MADLAQNRVQPVPARLLDLSVLDHQVEHAVHLYNTGRCSLVDAMTAAIDSLVSTKRALATELARQI